MRRLLLHSLLVLAIISACASPPPLPPSTIAKVKFVNEISVDQPLSIVVAPDGNIYTGQKNGMVSVFSAAGELLFTLPVAKDEKGRPFIRKPIDIAVSDGNIYVIDQASSRVVIFSAEGEFVEAFGRRGSSFKQFSSPSGIVVRDGIIYVADRGNSRIQIFDKSGVFLGVIDGVLAEDDLRRQEARLREPVDLGVDFRGNIYVVDQGDNTVKIFSQTGEYLGKLPDLIKPVSVAVANDGVYVADGESYSVKKFDFDHAFDLTFGSRGKSRTQFASVQALASDASGKVYVVDYKKGLIHVFQGEPGEKFSAWQKVPPITSVRWQKDIAVTSRKIVGKGDDLYVADGRSIHLVRNGEVLNSISGKKMELVSVAVAPDGAVWGVDKRKKRVIKFDEQGEILMQFGNGGRGAGTFRRPSDVAISSAGLIFVADPGNDVVQIFNGDGVFLNAIGKGAGEVKFENPLAIDISSSDVLYVLDGSLGTVFSFAADGKAIGSFGREGESESIFADPVDVAATEDQIFVLDKGRNSLKAFDTEGRLVRSFGCGGKGKGGLRLAESITALGGTTLLVSDTGNKRIQIWENIYTPETPVDVSAQAGMRNISLSWQGSTSSNVDGYRIWRAVAEEGMYSPISEVSAPSFVDRGVEPGDKYFYRVSALARGGNESRKSGMVSGVPVKFRPAPIGGLKGSAEEWSVSLAWDLGEEDFVTGYNIYRKNDDKLEPIGSTGELSFIDSGLSSNSLYTYLVTAVSSDQMESDTVSIEITTKQATKPPLGIELVAMDNIFSNTYKKYENEGVGRINVTNNTGLPIEKIKISFTIKEFMDFPSDMEIDLLAPGESQELLLKAVFNNNILNVTEDTPIQTEIEASFYEDEQLRTFSRSFPANVYEKHRMMWDERRQFATFITPKDPVLLEFVRSIAAQYREDDFSMQRSAAVFGSLGVLGLAYIPDPSNPYQITSNQTNFVDYIQYPQETLQRKSGDCDDLVALYSSALESLGMRTKVIEVPGHMLMMFSTGIEAGEDADTMDGLFIIHEDKLWVAVETTMVGSSFIKAWEKGSEIYYKWLDKGLSLLDIQEAWTEFKPASLQHGDWRPVFIERKDIDERFRDEFSTLKRIGLRLKSRKYRDRFTADNTDVDAAMQIGIIYGKAGETFDALNVFEKVLEIEPGHSAALNNVGNIHLLEKRYEEAVLAYEKAVTIEPDDALLWVNLARCYVFMDNKEKARESFGKAQEIDAGVVQKYRVLAMELLSAI